MITPAALLPESQCSQTVCGIFRGDTAQEVEPATSLGRKQWLGGDVHPAPLAPSAESSHRLPLSDQRKVLSASGAAFPGHPLPLAHQGPLLAVSSRGEKDADRLIQQKAMAQSK